VVRVGYAQREIARLRWAFIPYWARDTSIGLKTINARGETLSEKRAFRDAFQRRRCLVPMVGFYEWQKRPVERSSIFVASRVMQIFTGRA
jgi:putative SOS response-associated peptidase YedK